MKKLIPLFVLVAIFYLFACKTKSSPANAVKRIHFAFTELGRETQFRITCDKFDFYFPTAKAKDFIKSNDIEGIMQSFTTMKSLNDGTQPDVRGKIYITYTNKDIDTLCVGVKALTYKGATYETPQYLLRLIQK